MHIIILPLSRQIERVNKAGEDRGRRAGAALSVTAGESAEADVAALEVRPGALRASHI